MSTFSDLPRYPTDSIDEPDGPSEFDGSIRAAVTVAHTVSELLLIVTPLFAVLWWIVCLPILVALLLAAATRDDRR